MTHAQLRDLTVAHLMTRRLLTIRPDQSARLAIQMMLWAGVRHLPVVEGEAAVGLLGDRDLLGVDDLALPVRELLRSERPVLVLGGLFDGDTGEQRPFGAPRPRRFWQVTWAFALERLDQGHTRLHVRARAAAPAGARLRIAAVGLVHRFMETMQLRHLKERVEGRAAPAPG